jgi:hypothetical protein
MPDSSKVIIQTESEALVLQVEEFGIELKTPTSKKTSVLRNF